MLKANSKDNIPTSLKSLSSKASIFDFEQANVNVCGKSGAEQRHRCTAVIVDLFYLTC